MKIIARPKGAGKTTDLIKMSAKHYYHIICRNRYEAGRIYRQARNHGLGIPHPITYTEVTSAEFHPSKIKGFLLDDLEDFLIYLLHGVIIHAVTITTKEDGD